MNKYLRTVNILGIQVTPISSDEVISQIDQWTQKKQRHYICLCPNYSIMMSQNHPKFRQSLNRATLTTADGRAVAWACRLHGYGNARQVRGTDLMRLVCHMSAEKGLSNFFYGGTEEILEKLVWNLRQQYPKLQVAGTYAPPFRPLTLREQKDMLDVINASQPDIVWVGLGAPKQELWMAEHSQALQTSVMIGVGAAFDFLSGVKTEAPRWIQRAALEWLFRWSTEPGRLWKRNMYHPIFIAQVILQRLSRRVGQEVMSSS